VKTTWRKVSLVTAALLTIALLALLWNTQRRSLPPGGPTVQTERPDQSANLPTQAAGRVFRSRRVDLSEDDKLALRVLFQNKLKPALLNWSKAYHGHIPFNPDDLTSDNFADKIGRGTYCQYVFVLNGITVGIEDANGATHVNYLNAPPSTQLMQLPHGAPPNTDLPVSRTELAEMLKRDSGKEFSQQEIRVAPTALSSAMNGGANVRAGGDAINIATWTFTMVFDPSGNLTYYSRGKQ
jgi:hypothetical protein